MPATNGQKAADNKVFEVHEPYSKELFARVAADTRADARAALDAAAKAFPSWAQSAIAERARFYLKAAEIVRRRRNEIAEILARETGSTISFSLFQKDLVAATAVLQQLPQNTRDSSGNSNCSIRAGSNRR